MDVNSVELSSAGEINVFSDPELFPLWLLAAFVVGVCLGPLVVFPDVLAECLISIVS